MTMAPALLLTMALAGPPAAAQSAQLNAVTANGDFCSVMNLYSGRNEYLQISKVSSGGGVLWRQVRDNMVDERAAALATDQPGGVMVAAVQKINGRRTMILFHYTTDGQYDWQRVYSDTVENVPTTAIVDRDGNFYVGGNALKGSRFVARLWKYEPNGNPVWMREYDNGSGNTYARQLNIDVSNNAILGIESFQSQTATSGQYTLVTATYDPYGSLVSVR